MLPHDLTWMQDSRPRKLTLGVTLWVESDLEVENTQILHPDIKHEESRSLYKKCVLINLLVPLFFQLVHRVKQHSAQ